MEYVYYREPGLLYDLYRTFMLKLNVRPMWINLVANAGYENEDIQYVVDYLNRFQEPRRELIVFFYLRERNSSSFFANIFIELFQKRHEKLCLDDFLQYLQDEMKLQEEISRFYLGQDRAYRNLEELADWIEKEKSIRSPEVKFHLMSFFIQPRKYLDMLREWFASYYKVMEEIYDEGESVLQRTCDELDLELLDEGLIKCNRKGFGEAELIRCSILLISKNIVIGFEKVGWHLIGVDYTKTLRNEIDLQITAEKFGEAIGDRQRARIMEIVLEEGEVSSSELARRLGMAMNTVYYHLDILKRVQLLCSFTQRKAEYYLLNTRVCERVRNMILQWIGGDKDEAVEKTGDTDSQRSTAE